MPKLVDVNKNELFKDVVLWEGTKFSDTGALSISHDPHKFKEIIVLMQFGIISIIPIIYGVNEYYAPYSHNSSYLRTGYTRIKITTSTIQVINHYIAHQFNGSHPDDSAVNILKIIGRY